MAELARLKNKRSSIRGKLTRILKATDKLFTDDLRNLDKKELTASKSTTSTAARLAAPFKLKIPTFSGQVSKFQSFYDRFSDLMLTHAESYSDQNKCCLLTEAIILRFGKWSPNSAQAPLVTKMPWRNSALDTAEPM